MNLFQPQLIQFANKQAKQIIDQYTKDGQVVFLHFLAHHHLGYPAYNFDYYFIPRQELDKFYSDHLTEPDLFAYRHQYPNIWNFIEIVDPFMLVSYARIVLTDQSEKINLKCHGRLNMYIKRIKPDIVDDTRSLGIKCNLIANQGNHEQREELARFLKQELFDRLTNQQNFVYYWSDICCVGCDAGRIVNTSNYNIHQYPRSDIEAIDHLVSELGDKSKDLNCTDLIETDPDGSIGQAILRVVKILDLNSTALTLSQLHELVTSNYVTWDLTHNYVQKVNQYNSILSNMHFCDSEPDTEPDSDSECEPDSDSECEPDSEHDSNTRRLYLDKNIPTLLFRMEFNRIQPNDNKFYIPLDALLFLTY